jgi:hypothetical protein
MIAKTFSSLMVAASLAVSSLGFAATPATTNTATPAPVAAKSTKIRHTRRPGVSKVTAPTTSAKSATPAVQPRTPSKTSSPKVSRSSKVARPAAKSASTPAPAVR